MLPVVIRSLDGKELAVAVPLVNLGEPVVMFSTVLSGRGRLLSGYFQDGLRAVIVDCGEVQLQGSLSTRWSEDHRLWAVELRALPRRQDAAAQPAAAVQVLPQKAAEGPPAARPIAGIPG